MRSMTLNHLEAQLKTALGKLSQTSSDSDLDENVKLPKLHSLRPAAVLVAIDLAHDIPKLILIRRSSKLKHHPGQIAFAGGKRDAADKTIEQTALREAYEEIRLPPDSVQVLGNMPSHETVTGFSVTPVLGLIRDEFTPVPDKGEVAEVFSVPFGQLTDLSRFSIQSRHWKNARKQYYTVPYGPYYIWGATARILRALAEGMRR